MPKDFDRILKENLGLLFIQLSEKYHGLRIVHWEETNPELTGTYEREVDFLYMAEGEDGEKFLLHQEFQARDDPDMPTRIMVYHALLYEKYRLKIHHQVIYLGESPSKMRAECPPEALYEGFHLIELRNQDLRDMLQSDIPEEIVLSILSDFGDWEPERSLRAIFDRLIDLDLNETQLLRSISQLNILSRLRKLDSKVEQVIEDMPIKFDINIEEDAFYKRGVRVGIEQGIEKGIKQGKKEGEDIERLRSAARFVRLGIPIEDVAQTQGISVEEIQAFMAKSQPKK